jgi:hypothetical protein
MWRSLGVSPFEKSSERAASRSMREDRRRRSRTGLGKLPRNGSSAAEHPQRLEGLAKETLSARLFMSGALLFKNQPESK